MLRHEEAIGDYTVLPSGSNGVNRQTRRDMVLLIGELHLIKKYKIETLYMAVSLADKYLLFLTVK